MYIPMKPLSHTLVLLTSLFLLASCGEDRSGEYYALVEDNLFIEQVMKEHYLWYDSIPEVKQMDYFAEPEEFLKKLVYRKAQNGKGDPYSYVESTATLPTPDTESFSRSFLQRTSTYGFDFELMNDPTGVSSHVFARVLYVLPQSPASEAGLQRGDWISAVGRDELTAQNYGYLMTGGATSFARESLVFDSENNASWVAFDTLQVGPARRVEINPFQVDTVYHIAGRKIAYLMYNEFSTGPNNQAEDTEYREQMRQRFARFRQEAPDAFILDLRYNPGGYLSCATDLASYLAPAAALGKVFCTTKYNNLTEPQEVDFPLNAALAGENLNLSKLYVLTSLFTASASEAVINGLRPYFGNDNLVVIGETTEGKNVAMQPYQDKRFPFIVWPVVAYVLNAEGSAHYARGIQPTFELSERRLISPLYPLGDIREFLLHNTLEYITTGVMPDLPPAENPDTEVQGRSLFHSMSLRSLPGIRLQ